MTLDSYQSGRRGRVVTPVALPAQVRILALSTNQSRTAFVWPEGAPLQRRSAAPGANKKLNEC